MLNKKIFIGSLILCLYSCCNDNAERKSPGERDSTNKHVSSNNMMKIDTATEKVSTDSNALKKILTYDFFRPTEVKFLLSEADGSAGMNNIPRLRLEAVLYFDTATFQRIIYNYMSADWVSPEYNKEEFEFGWLDSSIRKELKYSPVSYSGHPDFFFTNPADSNSHLWIVNNKILVHYYRN